MRGHGARFVFGSTLLALAVFLSGFGGGGFTGMKGSVAAADLDQFANVTLPPDLGQSSLQVYVPDTGHSMRGYFLDYWRATGGADMFGYPISEPFASTDGLYSQAFENGIFQFRLELIWTEMPSVTLMPIGQMALDDRQDELRTDGRRGGGGGDRRSSSWKAVSPQGVTALSAVNEGGVWWEATGHTMSREVYAWYQANDGPFYLGNPISQPLQERGLTVQYFDGAKVIIGDDGGVRLAALGREMAPKLGIETDPIDGSGMALYSPGMFYNVPNPNPLGDLGAAGKKWIEIDIAEQRLYAYQGNTLITSTLVSTGLSPNDTEIGTFYIRYKLEKQDMAGTVDASGQVVALGEEAAEAAQQGQSPNQAAYTVEDVPNVMYFNYDAEALHGAYWHSNFGNRMSHGCVNLPLDMARFLYAWAPLGTKVWVHE